MFTFNFNSPTGKQLDALFLNYINTFVNLVNNLQVQQQLVMPGGWQTLDGGHVCLYVLRRVSEDLYSFTVINTGPDGLEFHPSNFDEVTGTFHWFHVHLSLEILSFRSHILQPQSSSINRETNQATLTNNLGHTRRAYPRLDILVSHIQNASVPLAT